MLIFSIGPVSIYVLPKLAQVLLLRADCSSTKDGSIHQLATHHCMLEAWEPSSSRKGIGLEFGWLFS